MKKKSTSLSHIILYVTLLMFPVAAHAQDTPNSYFNMKETRSRNLVPFSKWTGMMARFGEQKKIPDSECGTVRYHPCVIGEWQTMLETLRTKPIDEQLDEVNDWGNKHPYVVDQLNWGLEDYWETAYEFMEINGDCEDYAIAKYYSLRSLGVSADKMRIIIVQDLNLGGIIHAVLGVYSDNELFILDNQSQQVLPALKIYHYRPIYGLNEAAWWAYHSNI